VIRPAKYLDLTTSVVRIAAIVLEELQRRRSIHLRDLSDRIQAEVGERGLVNLIPSLNLLYLLGCLDYDGERDVVQSLVRPGSAA
jgi:hypothetical protein